MRSALGQSPTHSLLKMQFEQSVIDSLVASPAEALNVEIKTWIDPAQPAGIEKIVKATFALRNRNGGYMLIGFDDKTLAPDTANRPANVRAIFNLDDIQAIISRYSQEPFEIAVAFGSRDGKEHPVIVVPPGVKTPVAATRDLQDGGRTRIRVGAVYFRTLASNGVPSSSEARPADWRDILEICFDNREADIGRFLRRHLAGRDLPGLLASLAQYGTSLPPPVPTLSERSTTLLDEGEKLFSSAIGARQLSAEEQQLVDFGSWSVALVIEPAHPAAKPDQTFINTIASSNPNYTGWPVWHDTRAASDARNRPKVTGGCLEALIFSIVTGWSAHLDYWRLNPKGEFYLHRVLQDDGVPDRVQPGTALDPVITIIRVAEAIAVGISYAKALGWEPDKTTLAFAFRWKGLAGRQLSRWADPFDTIMGGTAHDDQITAQVEIPLDTPLSALAPAVEKAVADLFVSFGGVTIPSATIEHWVQRLIERRLN
ncbi:helix-turn-helix domain-containing protein [Bradyrhizobium sp. WSM1417]|uniref:AlbA family DNA-binding domain-containing protein n=1 Tax=Bradyrhizobium sp. WSM1417 TaxID=754500 RepID=UPI0012EC9D7E|nr:ATP-binding protein [Bradyrhizobium sp. WSM1417]